MGACQFLQVTTIDGNSLTFLLIYLLNLIIKLLLSFTIQWRRRFMRMDKNSLISSSTVFHYLLMKLFIMVANWREWKTFTGLQGSSIHHPYSSSDVSIIGQWGRSATSFTRKAINDCHYQEPHQPFIEINNRVRLISDFSCQHRSELCSPRHLMNYCFSSLKNEQKIHKSSNDDVLQCE